MKLRGRDVHPGYTTSKISLTLNGIFMFSFAENLQGIFVGVSVFLLFSVSHFS